MTGDALGVNRCPRDAPEAHHMQRRPTVCKNFTKYDASKRAKIKNIFQEKS